MPFDRMDIATRDPIKLFENFLLMVTAYSGAIVFYYEFYLILILIDIDVYLGFFLVAVF